MDVNGTRFHLVLGKSDWASPAGACQNGVEWANGALKLCQRLPVFPPHRGVTPPSLDARRGASRDRHGHWYWISDDRHEVRVAYAGRRTSVRFWSAAEAAASCVNDAPDGTFAPATEPVITPLQLSGLAVTTEHYLIVGRVDRAGVLVFDLRGGGAPLQLDWPKGVPFAPFDISAAADGGVWILDRDARALWRLDRHFRAVWPGAANGVDPSAFLPEDPSAVSCAPPAPLSDRAALPLVEVEAPLAVEALPDGSVLVLDNPALAAGSIVHRYRLDGTHFAVTLDPSIDPYPQEDGAAPLPLAGYDFAFVREGTTRPLVGNLFVADHGGNQAYAFRFESHEDAFSLTLLREYLPLRRFTGKAIVAAGEAAYYDLGERWIGIVDFPSPRFERTADVRLPAGAPDAAFDGKEVRCVWHRLLIDGCIPHETAVTIETRSADRPELLVDLPWTTQPPLYRRGNGAELPYYRAPVDTSPQSGTWELLLQNVVGRYLQLRLRIAGTGRTSPRLRVLRIHYPRFSYLQQYLPAVYRDDAVSASFLDRYLANMEGTFTTIEGKIEHVEELFDARTIPPEYLDWLAGWFGATLDFNWSDRTRRLFLAHAPQMFRERGTCAGLVRAVRLALDPCPTDATFSDAPCSAGTPSSSGFGVRVVERFRTRRAAGVVFGDPTDVVGPGATTNVTDWTPALAALPMHQRYRDVLRQEYGGAIADLNTAWGSAFAGFDDPALLLAGVRPPAGARANDWQQFVQAEIGFTYAVVTDLDEPLYREFLARRYGQPSAVNTAYQLDASRALVTFADVKPKLWDGVLHDSLPPGGAWLRDWIQFVSLVLPMDRSAHRFTVLVPVGLQDSPDDQLEKERIAARVARIEAPAHAAFDVKLYWGLFRVGEARVGLDTLLGQGSRSVALVLDRGVSLLAAAHLAYTEPWNAPPDRIVVGQEGNDGEAGVGGTCGCGPTTKTKTRTGGCGCERG